MASALEPVMTVAELEDFLSQAFPGRNNRNEMLELGPGRALIGFTPGEAHLRPGKLVSGPAQMGLADHAAYVVILAHIGPVAMAVTSNLNFTFLRGVKLERLFAEARLLRLGRRLATVDVLLWQDDRVRPVGQATVTYVLPDA